MDNEIRKLESCLVTMKKCLKIPNVENCICFSDAFKVLNLEVNRLQNIQQSIEAKEKITAIKDEIEKIEKNISSQEKECLGCNPCMAAVLFKAYPEALNSLYADNEL
jgi:septal ring factor EnvC (AmiA/AmiB activator)